MECRISLDRYHCVEYEYVICLGIQETYVENINEQSIIHLLGNIYLN